MGKWLSPLYRFGARTRRASASITCNAQASITGYAGAGVPGVPGVPGGPGRQCVVCWIMGALVLLNNVAAVATAIDGGGVVAGLFSSVYIVVCGCGYCFCLFCVKQFEEKRESKLSLSS